MSSRLPTSASSRSVSSSIVATNSSTASGGHVDVALAEAGDRRLDRRQRRAQVVRHRLQQRARSVVGLGQVGGPTGLGLQALALGGGGELGGERRSAPAGPRPRQRAAGQRQRRRRRRAPRLTSASSGAIRAAPAPTTPAPPTRRPARRSRAAARNPNVGPQLAEHLADRAGPGQRRRRARPAPRPRPAGGRRGSRLRPTRSTSTATIPAATTNTTSASTFSPSAIVESVERRGEEPVGEQEPAERRLPTRGEHAADDGDDHASTR